ncbi:MAG: hypothetical protein ABI461_06475 [Polyangiaceae bacterium]|jgi:hypothetical protein
MIFGDCETTLLATELREARDIIVQLQRELERARGVIEEQRAVVARAERTRVQSRRGE